MPATVVRFHHWALLVLRGVDSRAPWPLGRCATVFALLSRLQLPRGLMYAQGPIGSTPEGSFICDKGV